MCQQELPVIICLHDEKQYEFDFSIYVLFYNPLSLTPSKNSQQNSLQFEQDGKTSDCLYNQCERVMMEAANARRDAFLEAIARRKSEKETVNALHRVRLICLIKTFIFLSYEVDS